MATRNAYVGSMKIADSAQIDQCDQHDHPNANLHADHIQRGISRGERFHAGRNRHGYRQRVGDQQRPWLSRGRSLPRHDISRVGG